MSLTILESCSDANFFVADTHLDDWTPHKTRQRFVCPSPIPASPPSVSLAPPLYLPHGSSQGEGFSTVQSESVNFHCRERERGVCVCFYGMQSLLQLFSVRLSPDGISANLLPPDGCRLYLPLLLISQPQLVKCMSVWES